MNIDRKPGEVIEFLDKLKESHLKYCNVKKVSSKLERDKVIDQGQKQQIDKCQSNAEANELFHQFLRKDPAPETLKGAAKVLESAPETTNMNKRCAKVIEAFLFGIDQSVEEKRPDEVIKFLDELKKDDLQYCHVKKVSSKLERDKVIDKAQKQQIDNCLNDFDANELFHHFLCDDPAPETLKGAAEVLKNAPGTTNMNKKCAKAIEDFVGIDPAQLLEAPGTSGTHPPSAPGPSGTHPPSAPGPSGTHPPSAPGPSGTHPPSAPGPSGTHPPSAPDPSGTHPPSAAGPSGTHPPSAAGPSGTHPPSAPGPSGTHPPSATEKNWKEMIQSKHWVYLLGNLSVDKIVDHLYQGVDGKSLVTEEVYDEIENAKSKKEANKIFLKHLLNAGTEESFKLLCTVLQQTSGDYQIHEEILEKLKMDFQL